MKTGTLDPWRGTDTSTLADKNSDSFEDSFVQHHSTQQKLSDHEEYLAKLYSRLNHLQGGTSKKDLVASLSSAKEDCIARLITSGHSVETEEESELVLNPLIRHIAPHLQALTASELVNLLKADVLQVVTEEQREEIAIDTTPESHQEN